MWGFRLLWSQGIHTIEYFLSLFIVSHTQNRYIDACICQPPNLNGCNCMERRMENHVNDMWKSTIISHYPISTVTCCLLFSFRSCRTSASAFAQFNIHPNIRRDNLIALWNIGEKRHEYPNGILLFDFALYIICKRPCEFTFILRTGRATERAKIEWGLCLYMRLCRFCQKRTKLSPCCLKFPDSCIPLRFILTFSSFVSFLSFLFFGSPRVQLMSSRMIDWDKYIAQ